MQHIMVHFPFVQENLAQDLELSSVNIYYLQSHIYTRSLINLITNLFHTKMLETNLHMPTQNLKTYSYRNLNKKSF